MPRIVAPQLATPTPTPAGDDWLHEIKYDGYRTMLRIEDGIPAFITRGGADWTARYIGRAGGRETLGGDGDPVGEGLGGDFDESAIPGLAAAARRLPCRQAILDGELVVFDDNGLSDFPGLQQALSRRQTHRLVLVAFDLLHLDGWDIRDARLVDRRRLLAALVATSSDGSQDGAIRFSDHVVGQGAEVFERAAALGLEGIVSKRADSRYRSGRSASGTKAKVLRTGDFQVAGYTPASHGGLGTLVLAEADRGTMRYRGRVSTGFTAATLAALAQALAGLEAGAGPALAGAPRGTRPVRPGIVAHVAYVNRTAPHALRHPVLRSWRLAAPGEAAGTPELAPTPTARLPSSPPMISEADLASVFLDRPEQPMLGDHGPTRLEIALYHARVGELMLPRLVGRPVEFLRRPTGIAEAGFIQRHGFTGMPPGLATDIPDPAGPSGPNRTAPRLLAIGDARSYLALVQFSIIEIRSRNARLDNLDLPDRMIFGLSPGPGVPRPVLMRRLAEAAEALRRRLEREGFVPFVKTAGENSLHLVVPLVPGAPGPEVLAASPYRAASSPCVHPISRRRRRMAWPRSSLLRMIADLIGIRPAHQRCRSRHLSRISLFWHLFKLYPIRPLLRAIAHISTCRARPAPIETISFSGGCQPISYRRRLTTRRHRAMPALRLKIRRPTCRSRTLPAFSDDGSTVTPVRSARRKLPTSRTPGSWMATMPTMKRAKASPPVSRRSAARRR